jgi:GNAT superfamily N-acetyltransferase
MTKAADEIDVAIEVFVRGYVVGKSRTHPYTCEKIGGAWLLRDAPRKNVRDYRKEEWVFYNADLAAVDRLARAHTRGRFFVSAVAAAGESDAELRAEFKRLGYRLLVTEPFFVHRLRKIPRAKAPVTIEQVKTGELAARLAAATRSRPILPEQLRADAPFRQYVALAGEEIVGWVRSVYAGESAWCSDMKVRETQRRRGIGSALLIKMLRDDRKHGVKMSVLLSSHTGALVYPRVGYEQIGTLLIFAPRKN